MAQFDTVRFADMRVGQSLPATAASRLGDTRSWSKLAQRYVQDWAGRGALVAKDDAPHAERAAEEVDQVTGSIYARHLDGSLNVDVKVVGRTRSGTELVDIVRVRLS